MTRDDILALDETIDRQMRRQVLLTALVPLAILLFASTAEPDDLVWTAVILISGLSMLPLLWIRWAQTYRPVRYAGGPLRSRTSRSLTLTIALNSLGALIVFAWLAYSWRDNLIALVVFGGGAVWYLLATFVQFSRSGEARPLYVVDRDGYFDSAAMKVPVTWDQVTGLAPFRYKGSLALALQTTDDPANHGPQRKVTEASGLKGYALNLSAMDHKAADLLLAIAENRPALIEALGPLLTDGKLIVRPGKGVRDAGPAKGFVALIGIVRLLFNLAVLGLTALCLIVLAIKPGLIPGLAVALAPLIIFSVLILAEAWARRPMRQTP